MLSLGSKPNPPNPFDNIRGVYVGVRLETCVEMPEHLSCRVKPAYPESACSVGRHTEWNEIYGKPAG